MTLRKSSSRYRHRQVKRWYIFRKGSLVCISFLARLFKALLRRLTISFRDCIGNGKAEFAVITQDGNQDVSSWMSIRRAAHEIVRRCDQGQGVHWGGHAIGLGKWNKH